MPQAFKTPEQAHSTLMDAIDYELETYGPSSLADMIAAMLDGRIDSEDNSTEAKAIRAMRDAFAEQAEQLPKSPLWYRSPADD